MKRNVVSIDQSLCDGCAKCIANCFEGALEISNKKVVLISEEMCDGHGVCIDYCPQNALSLENKEALAYNEMSVLKKLLTYGRNAILVHLEHQKENKNIKNLDDCIDYLEENQSKIDFDVEMLKKDLFEPRQKVRVPFSLDACGDLTGGDTTSAISTDFGAEKVEYASELNHWPLKMKLINPNSKHFKDSDFIFASDCAAYAYGNFHQRFLKGRTIALACPKLEDDTETYTNKLLQLIDNARIDTLTLVMMEVPCCSGILSMAKEALKRSEHQIPIKSVILAFNGEILSEEWVVGN